jgi:glycosyltransferase involved in cell wall biosynthesis
VTGTALRIAFVYDALYPYVNGGAERRYYELGRELSDRHDVHFVSWQWWDGPAQLRRDGMTFHGVGRPPGLYGRDGKRTVREAVGFSARLPRVLLRERFDVIDCAATPYLPLYATWLATRLRRTRLIATWHEFWGEHWGEYLPDRPLVAAVARRVEAGSRRLGDGLVAVSGFTAHRMDLADDARVTVVGNGVALDEIDREPAIDAPQLVYVGRLIDEKRVELLLQAMHLLRDRFPVLHCAIVGDGPEAATLRRLAADLGLDGRVEFRGQVDESTVIGLIKGASMLILPSIREGFGMAVAEAQACGTVPVVVRSLTSGAPDLVRDGVDGVLVDPTGASLAEGIASVLADPDRLETLAHHARAAGMARAWDLLASRMEPIYRGDQAMQPIAATGDPTVEPAGDAAAALQ